MLSDIKPTGLGLISDNTDEDDDDVKCFYSSSVECCTGMLRQCVDSPVFYNRTV